MSQHNFRNKIPETCRYWREGKCQKGEYQCNFVHGFICPNDGRCWKENCNKIHLQKKPMPPREYFAKAHMNYQRPGPRPRYRRSHSRSLSPPRHRKVPQRGRSPIRRRSRSRSPTYHTRVYSPYQRRSRSSSPLRGVRRSRSRSPSPIRGVRRSRSRSPSLIRGMRRSRSRSRSPSRGVRRSRNRSLSPLRGVRRSRSRSLSPLRGVRRTVSPMRRRIRSRSRSGSWRHSRSRSASQPRSRNHNQSRIMSRSQSPVRSRSKSHGLAKLHSRSPSPKPKRSSSSSSNSSSRSSSSSKKRPRRTGSHGHNQNSSPSSLKDKDLKPVHSKSKTPVPEIKDDDKMTPQRNSSNAGRRMQLDLENICGNLECETDQKSVVPETLNTETAEKEAISRLRAQIAKDFMNPETQKLMEKVLALTKENATKSHQPEENKSKKEFFLDEVGDDIELDLEEVGEEVDDIFAKSLNRSMDESSEDGIDKGMSSNRKIGLKAGSNPSPPKSKPISKPEKSSDFRDADFHSDWDLKAALETASKCLKKPPQMPPPNQQADGSKTGSTSLWTPALIRNQTQAPKKRIGYLPKDNDWEVETPYVGRKDKSEMQRPAAPSKTATATNEQQTHDVSPAAPFALPEPEPLSTRRNSHKAVEMTQEKNEKIAHPKDTLFPSAQSVISSIPTKVSRAFNEAAMTSAGQSAHATGMMPPCAADLIRDAAKEKESYYSPKEHATAPKKVAEEQTSRKPSESPKRSSRKRRKEKKPKRKKDSSEDDDDSSESDNSKEDKKLPQEKEKDTDELEVLLFKKESLMKRVKLLMEQKNMMSSQREDIINNHKGSKTSLASILEENSFLIKEIGKQIGNINGIVKNINHDIDVKRGTLKQTASVSKDKSESPHVSRETYKTARYSAEKERVTKKIIKPVERSEGFRASPYQEKRAKSPYRKNSRSPSPLHHPKQVSSESERKSRNRDSGSRSPKGFRRKRSKSPSPNVSREGPKPVPPERKQGTSPPRKRPVKSAIEVSKKPAGPQASQYQAPKNTDTLHYAPHEAQRTYIRYIDQGMHWCKLCSLFCETAPEYVDHLMTESHLGRVKNDRKSWLCRAPKEEKEPKPPNAQVMTVPIQGLEFLHSLPSYYCSLCDTFMRDKGEALRHPDSKMHVSKYKVHRAQNPLFESTFLKAKTAAYAKYKIDEERKKIENELNLSEKTMSLENKLLKQIKEKIEKETKEERPSDSQDDSSRNCGSIRVASRGPRHSSDKKPSTSQPPHNSGQKHPREDSIPKSSDGSKRKSESVGHANDEPQKTQKSESKESEKEGGSADGVDGQERTIVEGKGESKHKEGSQDTDTDRKPVSTKLPLIGKMPFLKRKSGMTKSKEQQSTPVEEVPKQKKESAEEFHFPEKIPLPKSETGDSDIKKASQKVEEIKEMPLTIRPVAPPVEYPVTSVGSEDKAMTKNISNAPVLPDDEKTSEIEEKDAHGSDLYDPLEAGNEDSSDGVAAATIEALDLLNIPLPGFKTAPHFKKSSEMPILAETEDKYQPEDMEIESTPLILEEERIEEGKVLEVSNCPLETVYPSSGMITHPDIPLPSVVMAPPPMNLNNPPPPINLNNPPPPMNLNNPPPPINLNNPPPPINLNNPPPPINLNPPHPLNLNTPPPPLNLNNPPPPMNLNNPPPPMSLNNLPPPPPMSLNDPPPPGTEGPDFSLGSKINMNIPTGNMLPVFGPQEYISKSTPPSIDMQRQEDSEIPVPPGTEDEYSTTKISTVSYSSGKNKDKGDELDTQRHHSRLYSPKGNSLDVCLSFSDNVIKGSLKSTTEPSKTQQRNKNSLHDREKESTPPPPGTEGSPSEADSFVMNDSNKLSASDLEMVTLKSPLVPSDLEVHAKKEKGKFSRESTSRSNVLKAENSSSSLLSNTNQSSHSGGVSENVQHYGKNSSSECLTADTKLQELGSYHISDVRSHSPSLRQPDKRNLATLHGNTAENSGTPSKEPDKGNIPTSHGSTEQRSGTLSFKEPDIGNRATPHGKDEKSSSTLPSKEPETEYVTSSCRSYERPVTPPTKQLDTEKITTSCESQEWSYKSQDQQSTVKNIAASQGMMSEPYTLLPKQPDTRNIALSCGNKEQAHTSLTEHPDTGNRALAYENEKRPHTTLTVQPDTGNLASLCGCEEKPSVPLTEQPDTGEVTISPGSNVERSFTRSPEIITTLHESKEWVNTSQTKQPPADNIATSHERDKESICTLPREPDEGNKATSHEKVKEKTYSLHSSEPDVNVIAYDSDEKRTCKSPDLQLSTRNIITSHDSEENFCSSPSVHLNTRNPTTSQGSDEERSHATSLIQLDTGNQVTSHNDSLPQVDRGLSFTEGNSAVVFSTSVNLGDKDELTDSKTVASDKENYNKNSSCQSLTVDTNDKKQDINSEVEDETIEERSSTLYPKGHDTGNILSSSKLSVSQDSDEGLVSKECILNEQDSNSFSSLKEITEDSTECCDLMEKNLTHRSDVNDKSESPVIKSRSPLQFINFHKGFESMDIADLYLPSTSNSECIQSTNPSKFVSPQTEDKDASVTVENVGGVDKKTPDTIQTKIEFEEGGSSESDKKNCDSGRKMTETKAIQDTFCGQNEEPLAEELETSAVECSDSCKDYGSQRSTDSETETFPHEMSLEGECIKSMQKVQKGRYNNDGASEEAEDVESAALTDKTHSSEDEVVTSVGSAKGGKRKHRNVRKTTRKRAAQFEWIEENECTPPRTSASRSSASHQTQSVVESPRPMRSSRRAAAAAIKAMAKDQDDTPPDSPPSDDDTDYSD